MNQFAFGTVLHIPLQKNGRRVRWWYLQQRHRAEERRPKWLRSSGYFEYSEWLREIHLHGDLRGLLRVVVVRELCCDILDKQKVKTDWFRKCKEIENFQEVQVRAEDLHRLAGRVGYFEHHCYCHQQLGDFLTWAASVGEFYSFSCFCIHLHTRFVVIHNLKHFPWFSVCNLHCLSA